MDTVGFRQDRDGDGTAVLAVTGEVDLACVATLRDELEILVGRASSPVAVNLSGVTFIDSTGIAAIVRAFDRAAERNVALRVVEPSPIAARVLDLIGLSDLLVA